ncbi:MAG TPA: hypothetical protein VN193_05895 [Candidatus Angelobacter sp.]|nr:hypothetical protein [Candidatus Angelobacter sp.]
MLKGLLRRLGRSPATDAAAVEPPPPQPAAGVATIPRSPLLVDASTWTFWSRGATAAETLVETTGHPAERTASVSQRVAAMLEARDRTRQGAAPVVPRHDPAQAELLFVEMMRAANFERAYRLLAPECQARWGSEADFALAQHGSGHDQVRGAEVKHVELLEVWPDPDSGRVNREVAELTVEYLIDVGGREVLIERVVHCVLVEGRWRSLCYPPRPAQVPES